MMAQSASLLDDDLDCPACASLVSACSTRPYMGEWNAVDVLQWRDLFPIWL